MKYVENIFTRSQQSLVLISGVLKNSKNKMDNAEANKKTPSHIGHTVRGFFCAADKVSCLFFKFLKTAEIG
ncbi:hypothetical protein CSB11_01670 [Candidatus Campbellbacteria bacterium]|nr:MAG: hypothetical protein CSB11_01670 [Candidatus Campbellbacteria bacterium]